MDVTTDYIIFYEKKWHAVDQNMSVLWLRTIRECLSNCRFLMNRMLEIGMVSWGIEYCIVI